jgi:hypothetical protein
MLSLDAWDSKPLGYASHGADRAIHFRFFGMEDLKHGQLNRPMQTGISTGTSIQES